MENPGRVLLNKGRNERECDALSERDQMDGWMDGSINHTIRCKSLPCTKEQSVTRKLEKNDETAKIHKNNRKFN